MYLSLTYFLHDQIYLRLLIPKNLKFPKYSFRVFFEQSQDFAQNWSNFELQPFGCSFERLQDKLRVFEALESIMAQNLEIHVEMIQNQSSKGQITFLHLKANLWEAS